MQATSGAPANDASQPIDADRARGGTQRMNTHVAMAVPVGIAARSRPTERAPAAPMCAAYGAASPSGTV